MQEEGEKDIIKNCTSFIGHRISWEQLKQQGYGQGSCKEWEIMTHQKDHQDPMQIPYVIVTIM